MELDLRDYARILWKRRRLLVLVLIFCVGLAAFAVIRAQPVYQSDATLFVGARQVTVDAVRQGVGVSNLSARLLESYARIMTSRSTLEKAIAENDLPIDAARGVERLSANPAPATQIIELSFRAQNPVVAQRVVDAVAQTFVDEIARIEGPVARTSEPAIKVSIIDPATRPRRPISPQPVRAMALAIGFGLLLGAAAAVLRERLDVTVKNRAEIEDELELPVISAVPRIDTGDADVYLERDPQAAGAEAFRKVRTAIQFLGVDDPLRTILVTSPSAAEGKTTVALNLAAAFAQAGLRTILVEADLRRPSLHKLFPIEGSSGLTAAIVGRVPLERAIVETGLRNLACIPAGALPPNPVELLVSDHMGDVLNELRRRYDVIIIDTPPLLPVADASGLIPRTDGVVIVARAGNTHRERLREAGRLVSASRGRLLGVVLNALRRGAGGYEYEYYYRYGYRAEPPASWEDNVTEPPAETVARGKTGEER